MDSEELKLCASVLVSDHEGFFLVDLATRALKKSSNNDVSEHIKCEFDESLKNRQEQEKVKLELGKKKLKQRLRTDQGSKKNPFDASRIYPDTLNCFILMRHVFIQTH